MMTEADSARISVHNLRVRIEDGMEQIRKKTACELVALSESGLRAMVEDAQPPANGSNINGEEQKDTLRKIKALYKTAQQNRAEAFESVRAFLKKRKPAPGI